MVGQGLETKNVKDVSDRTPSPTERCLQTICVEQGLSSYTPRGDGGHRIVRVGT